MLKIYCNYFAKRLQGLKLSPSIASLNRDKMKNTNQNTIVKTAPNGAIYQVSQTFEVGDSVLIHNCITGKVSYSAVIKSYTKLANGSHIAVLFNSLNNGMYSNTLGTALIVKTGA